MTNKSCQTGKQGPVRRLPRVWLLVGGGLLLIAVAAIVSSRRGGSPLSVPIPQVTGAPRLAVDRTTADEGRVKFDVPVRTTFRLSNLGDRPLQILGEPQVELVVGC